MPLLLSFSQVTLSLILLLAAIGKILNGEEFTNALRLSSFPEKFVEIVQFVIPTVEILLSLALILSASWFLTGVLGAVVLLFLVFTIWVCKVYYSNLRIRCGCFGIGGKNIGVQTIVRNIFLLFLTIGGFYLSLWNKTLFPPLSFELVIVATCTFMVVFLFRAFQQAYPVLIFTLEDTLKKQRQGESS